MDLSILILRRENVKGFPENKDKNYEKVQITMGDRFKIPTCPFATSLSLVSVPPIIVNL